MLKTNGYRIRGAIGLLRASNVFSEIVPRDAVTITTSLFVNGLAAVTGNVIRCCRLTLRRLSKRWRFVR